MGQMENSKDKIIMAAVNVFAEKGFDSATVDEVSKRSGLSKGTVFLYFKKKDDLIKHIAMLSVPYDVIQATLDGRYKGAEEMLNAFGMAFMKKYKDSNMRSLLIATMANKDRYKTIKKRLKLACLDKMDMLFSNVEKLSGNKIPIVLRRSFFGSLLCYTIWWDDNPLSPEEYVRQLSKSILTASKQL
ncbi:MAG: TetR/AcrR family transcriptional regulator [Conexivisphaerales archaeon]